MKRLYDKLQTVGYTQEDINSMLPDWWDDEIAETPTGLQQASLILGQIFGIRAETLWTENAMPEFRFPPRQNNNKWRGLGFYPNRYNGLGYDPNEFNGKVR